MKEALEHAHRLAQVHDGGSVLEDLRQGLTVEAVAQRRGMPIGRIQSIASFYDLLYPSKKPHVCSGTACWSARKNQGGSFPSGASPVRCLGRCYEAPVATGTHIDSFDHPIPATSLLPSPVLFSFLGEPPPIEHFYALPENILDKVEQSGLKGRGGAAYPTGAKWRAAAQAAGKLKYVVVNGDEGDPGSFVDRLLMERAPHAMLGGIHACAHAIGATEAIVFIRAEYPHAAQVVTAAIEAARPYLAPGLNIQVRIGAGSYVCGEETALLRAIEGERGESTPKPPYPAERGLWGHPTVVQNVETLSMVPWILATGQKPAIKAFSLSGAIQRPGAVEAALGITLRELLEQGGGGAPAGVRWKMALVGGPMGTVIPEKDFDRALSYESMPGMGHGGVVVLDDRVSARELLLHLYEFAEAESCGNCTPCRVGTKLLAKQTTVAGLERLLDTLELGSLCGFGQGVPRPVRDVLAAFPGEIL